jgi:hypothetical protein
MHHVPKPVMLQEFSQTAPSKVHLSLLATEVTTSLEE